MIRHGFDKASTSGNACLHRAALSHARLSAVASASRIVPADNKRRARLNLIRHLLDSIPYKKVDIELPKAQRRPKDGTEGLNAGQPIPSHY